MSIRPDQPLSLGGDRVNDQELLPGPDTSVNSVNRHLGISTPTSLRLFSRASDTRVKIAATRYTHRNPTAYLPWFPYNPSV